MDTSTSSDQPLSAPDQEFAHTIRPTLEEAIRLSIAANPDVLANALFPAVGPSIRLAVATALQDMVASLSRVLDRSLSFRGVRWRWEAMRTGRPLGEVALLHNLEYRVDQVLLIHKETGLLIREVFAPSVSATDSELISGMLIAIQDFVRDSFGGAQETTLKTMAAGELSLWVEQGPQAALACVIRGNPPVALRGELQHSIQRIHAELGKELLRYEGDSSPLTPATRHLQACLQLEYRPDKPSTKIFWATLSLVATLLVAWCIYDLLQNRQWTTYLNKLKSRPGIVVTNAERRFGKYHLSGLRDPLADDPGSILATTSIDPKSVEARWEPYLSLSAPMLEIRARRLLRPPASVKLSVDAGVLRATGSAPADWIARSRELAAALPGVQQYDTSAMTSATWSSACESISRTTLRFAPMASAVSEEQQQAVKTLAAQILNLRPLSGTLGLAFEVRITGDADASGTENLNESLSLNRATAALNSLVAHGVPKELLRIVDAARTNKTRAVTFAVVEKGPGQRP